MSLFINILSRRSTKMVFAFRKSALKVVFRTSAMMKDRELFVSPR